MPAFNRCTAGSRNKHSKLYISLPQAITEDDSESRITNWLEVVLIVGVIVMNTIIGLRQE